MHFISAANFSLAWIILLENTLFWQQNARLKNRLFCSKFCRQFALESFGICSFRDSCMGEYDLI